MDLGTRNGTYINGKQIIPMTPISLNDSDEIAFGNQVYVFSLA